jgi:hypothetical protein
MTRAVQDVIEQKVAEKIIMGKLAPGSTLEFTDHDFPELGKDAHNDGGSSTTPDLPSNK